MTSSAVHHLHKRKRIHKMHEPYPHPDKWKDRLDMIVFGVALFSVIMTIPQVISVWSDHNVSGIAPSSWVAYTIAAFFWMLYGFVHKENKIIAVNAINLFLNALVVVGVWMISGHFML